MASQGREKDKGKPSKQSKRRAKARAYKSDLITQAAQPVRDMQDHSAPAVISQYKENNATVMSALQALKAQIGKLKQSDVRQYALKKADVKSVKGLREKLTQLGVDTEGIDNNTLTDLVALDDWGTIWKFAQPMVAHYGAKAVNWLWNKYVKKNDQGGDEGFNPVDWGGVLGPRRQTMFPGVNVHGPGIKEVQTLECEMDTVDGRSLATIFYPEGYRYRYSYINSQKVGLATPVEEYSLVSNASGNVAIAIFPRNAVVTGGGYTQSYMNVYRAADWDPNTGSQPLADCTIRSGPLYSVAGNFEAYRMNAYSMQVIPNASFNTAGTFTLGYHNRFCSGTNTLRNIGVTLSGVKMWPYNTTFNNKTVARMVAVSADGSDDVLVNTIPTAPYFQNQCFVLFATGFPVNTEIARLVFSGVYEVIPSAPAAAIIQLEIPVPAPGTEGFEAMIVARFPVLQQMDQVDAQRVWEAVGTHPRPFSRFLEELHYAISGIRPRQYAQFVSNPRAVANALAIDAAERYREEPEYEYVHMPGQSSKFSG